MGLFLVVSADYRVGADGPYKLTANEVALGLTMPRAAVEICRLRLAPAHVHRALSLADIYSPAGAVTAGILDQLVPSGGLGQAAGAAAARLATLDRAAHVATKLRVREEALRAIAASIEADARALSPV
jgi:enoyl-CoA hydratase